MKKLLSLHTLNRNINRHNYQILSLFPMEDVINRSYDKPNIISLFSGCGGLDLGFEKAGFNIIWAND